jgi:hypothetical protein
LISMFDLTSETTYSSLHVAFTLPCSYGRIPSIAVA